MLGSGRDEALAIVVPGGSGVVDRARRDEGLTAVVPGRTAIVLGARGDEGSGEQVPGDPGHVHRSASTTTAAASSAAAAATASTARATTRRGEGDVNEVPGDAEHVPWAHGDHALAAEVAVVVPDADVVDHPAQEAVGDRINGVEEETDLHVFAGVGGQTDGTGIHPYIAAFANDLEGVVIHAVGGNLHLAEVVSTTGRLGLAPMPEAEHRIGRQIGNDRRGQRTEVAQSVVVVAGAVDAVIGAGDRRGKGGSGRTVDRRVGGQMPEAVGGPAARAERIEPLPVLKEYVDRGARATGLRLSGAGCTRQAGDALETCPRRQGGLGGFVRFGVISAGNHARQHIARVAPAAAHVHHALDFGDAGIGVVGRHGHPIALVVDVEAVLIDYAAGEGVGLVQVVLVLRHVGDVVVGQLVGRPVIVVVLRGVAAIDAHQHLAIVRFLVHVEQETAGRIQRQAVVDHDDVVQIAGVLVGDEHEVLVRIVKEQMKLDAGFVVRAHDETFVFAEGETLRQRLAYLVEGEPDGAAVEGDIVEEVIDSRGRDAILRAEQGVPRVGVLRSAEILAELVVADVHEALVARARLEAHVAPDILVSRVETPVEVVFRGDDVNFLRKLVHHMGEHRQRIIEINLGNVSQQIACARTRDQRPASRRIGRQPGAIVRTRRPLRRGGHGKATPQ